MTNKGKRNNGKGVGGGGGGGGGGGRGKHQRDTAGGKPGPTTTNIKRAGV